MRLPISLKQLRYAVTVAQTGHFGRAAELCSVTQPALSQQIGALEARCGTPVFDRLTRGIRLTPFGEQLIDLAQATLVAADRQGARSTFQFSNFKENVGLTDKTFVFSIPRGAEVIHAGRAKR